ncbi:MAG: hypothetical protein CMH26_10070 [Micavibrio sp.]|nr:hypothetical protein [Micavibrio sp.]MAF98970.1 hypothetical protein [Micavibrio sp.]
MKFFTFTANLLLFFIFQVSVSFASQDVAICGEASGYSYYADRKMATKDNIGWTENKYKGQFNLKKTDEDELDIFFSGVLGITSVLSEGGEIIPATISDDALTLVAIYPNQLTETYIFQISKSGEYEAMWTQAKAETPFPNVTAFVSKCSYINFNALPTD